MKYSDHLSHPVKKKPNGYWYDEVKGYFSGYFFKNNRELEEMDLHAHFNNWEEISKLRENMNPDQFIIGCLDIQLRYLRIFNTISIVFT